MILKPVFVFFAVFLLAFVFDCKTLADDEPDSQDVEDSCQDNEQLNIQTDEVGDETVEGNQKLDVQGVYAKKSNDDVSITNSSNARGPFYVNCILNKTYSDHPVEIVNASRLAVLLQVELNNTNRVMPANCMALLFYSPSCPFSCMAAPNFNALPRFFPDVKMVAVDAMKYRKLNAQFGIVGTPTIMLFHGGRPAAKLNETTDYEVKTFAEFITKITGIKPVGKLVVTSADFGGPLSSVPVKETDYYLLLSWLVIGVRVLYSLYHSTWGRSLVDATLNAWREAEAQHHHVD